VFGDALPETYTQRVGTPRVVAFPDPDAMVTPSDGERGWTAQDDALRETQAAYRVDPYPDDRHALRLPIPTTGRPRNDLNAIEKLAWGLAIGVLAALLLGALTSLQHILL
jgi:hypothetical protein